MADSADIEWTVQLLQLKYAHRYPALHNTSTLESLDAIGSVELLGENDVALLKEAWLTATKARNALVLVRGKPVDQLPGPGQQLRQIAYAAGWAEDEEPSSSSTTCGSLAGPRSSSAKYSVAEKERGLIWRALQLAVLGAAGLMVGVTLIAVLLHYVPFRGPLLIALTSGVPFLVGVAFIPVVIFAGLRQWMATGVAVLAAAALVHTQVPLVVSADAPEGQSITVVSVNLLKGHADLGAVEALVRDSGADILSLQEVTTDWLDRARVSGIAQRLPYEHSGWSRSPRQPGRPCSAGPRCAATASWMTPPSRICGQSPTCPARVAPGCW